jgi:hypothetical protein
VRRDDVQFGGNNAQTTGHSRIDARRRSIEITRRAHQDDAREIDETSLVRAYHGFETRIVLLRRQCIAASPVRPELGNIPECLVWS